MAVLETKPVAVERSAGAGGTSPSSDDGTRHCAECNSPLAADQAACLECGAVVAEPTRYKRWLSARWPLRTGLATGTIFVLSASVALAASVASNSGGNPPPQAFAGTKTPGQIPIVPPSTVGAATDSSTSGNAPSAPTSTQSGGSSSTSAPKAPTTTAPSSPNPTESSAPQTAGPSSTGTGGENAGASTGRFEPFGGNGPLDAGAYGPGTQPGHTADLAVDGKQSTYWLTDSVGSGIWLKAGGYQYSKIGIQPAPQDAGFVVQVYGSQGDPAGSSPLHKIGSRHLITGATTLPLDGQGYNYYLLQIKRTDYTNPYAGIAELSLIP